MITQEQLPLVNTPSMNDTHFETMLLVNSLSTAIKSADADDVKEKFKELIEHTQEHCKHEEEMMVEKKFPPYLAHKEEHDVALEEMRKAAMDFTQTQDIGAAGKYLETNFSPWFLRHTETMDAVTSMFLENSEVHLQYWERLIPRK